MATSSIPLLLDPPFVAALVLLGTALGLRALDWLRVPLGMTTRLERGVLSAALGLGLLQVLPLALGAVGLLARWSVWAGLCVVAIVVAPDVGRVVRAIVASVRELRWRRIPAWTVPVGALMAVVLAVTLVQTLNIYMGNDDGYHLTAPKRWLEAGRLIYLPTLPSTNGPLGGEMLYMVVLAAWTDTAAKLLNFAFGVLGLLAIYALGRRMANAAVGFAAAALWLYGVPAMRIDIYTFTYIDLGLCFLFVSTALAWVLWLRSREGGWLRAAALLAGLTMTMKLTAAPLLPAFVVLLLFEARRDRLAARQAVRRAALFAALALLPLLPWLLRAWLLTGNPVYPAFSSLLPSRDLTPNGSRAFEELLRFYTCDITRVKAWSLPMRHEARLAAIALVTLGTAGCIALARRRDVRHLLWLAGFFILSCLVMTGIYHRYMMPAFALLFVLIALPFARPLATNRWVQAAAMLILCVKLLPHLRAASWTLKPSFEIASGRISRAQYLARYPNDLYAAWDYANASTTPDARLLVCFWPTLSFSAGHTFLCDRTCYVTDGFHQQHFRLDTWDHYLADVERDRMGYLVTTDRAFETFPMPDYPPARNEYPFARRLAADYGTLVFKSGDFEMYRLNPAAATVRAPRQASAPGG